MEEKKLVPKLRFPGFTEPWEQRKLGEEAIEILAGGDIEKEKVVYDSGYPIYANALTNDGLVGYYTDYYRVEAPAVTVTGRGEVGHAQARSQNFTPIVRLLAIRSKHDCYFLENAINNYKTIVESTGVPQLTVPQLSAYKLCFPLNIEEEKRISICFQNLDTLITLHQRKLEHLKLKKKSLLQKLFPKEGEVYPELRFPGFTAPWEQRKLGEIVSAYSGGTPSASNKEYYGGDIPFIRSAEINNNHTELYITQKGLKDSSAKLVEKGTILYAMYGATSGEVSISQIDGAINQAILAMVPLMYDGEFIAQYLRRQKKNIINKYLQGGQGNLSANIVLNLQIQLPGVDEANQITSFFVKLDNLITLHQEESFLHKYMLEIR